MFATILLAIILVSPSAIQLSLCSGDQLQHQQAFQATQMPPSTNKPATRSLLATVLSSNSSPLLATAGASQNVTTRLNQATTPTLTASAISSHLANFSTKTGQSNQSQAASESNTSKDSLLADRANVASANFHQNKYPISMGKLVAGLPYGFSLRNVASSRMVANPLTSSASASQPMLAATPTNLATHIANKQRAAHDIDNGDHDQLSDKSHMASSNGASNNNKVANITLNLNQHGNSVPALTSVSASSAASDGASLARSYLPGLPNGSHDAKLDDSDDGDYVDDNSDETDRNGVTHKETPSKERQISQIAAITQAQSRVKPQSSLMSAARSYNNNDVDDDDDASDDYTNTQDSSRPVKKERSLSVDQAAVRAVAASSAHSSGGYEYPEAVVVSRDHDHDHNHEDDDVGGDVAGVDSAAPGYHSASHNSRNNYEHHGSNKHSPNEPSSRNLVISHDDYATGKHQQHHHYGKFFQ